MYNVHVFQSFPNNFTNGPSHLIYFFKALPDLPLLILAAGFLTLGSPPSCRQPCWTCTLRRKWRNNCADHWSFPVKGQFSAPPPKPATGSQSGAEQSESIQQKHSPTDLFKRLDTSEKWKCEHTVERSDLSAIKAVKLSLFWWPGQLIKCQTSYRN